MNVEPSDSQAQSKTYTAYDTLKNMASFNNEEIHKLSLKVQETQTQSQEVTHCEEKESSSSKEPLASSSNANTSLSLDNKREVPTIHDRTTLLGSEEFSTVNLDSTNDLKEDIEQSRNIGSAVTHITQVQVHSNMIQLLHFFLKAVLLGIYILLKWDVI